MAAPGKEGVDPVMERGIPVGGAIALVLLSVVLAAAVAVIAWSLYEVTFVAGIPLGWYLGPSEIRVLRGGPMAADRLLGRLLVVPLAVVVVMAVAVTLLLAGSGSLAIVASISGVGVGVVAGFLARILLRLQWVTSPAPAA